MRVSGVQGADWSGGWRGGNGGLARSKSFFQETLEVRRGVFGRSLGRAAAGLDVGVRRSGGNARRDGRRGHGASRGGGRDGAGRGMWRVRARKSFFQTGLSPYRTSLRVPATPSWPVGQTGRSVGAGGCARVWVCAANWFVVQSKYIGGCGRWVRCQSSMVHTRRATCPA